MKNCWRPRCTNFLLISVHLWALIFAQEDLEPCTVTNSDSFLIVNIVESLGSQTDQSTDPVELPLSGTPGNDIELELVYSQDVNYFYLDGKRLKLNQAIDRDPEDLAQISLEVICTVLPTGKRKTIPLIVTISDINDNIPKFINLPYVATVPEDTPLGSVIFDGLQTIDQDSNVNGQVEYFIGENGGQYFEIDLPHQGLLKLKKALDFEQDKSHLVTIIARDRAVNPQDRFSASTTLTVNVLDSNDQPPKFVHDKYTSKVVSGVSSGALEVRPEKIHAEDQDTIRSSVEYEFLEGFPSDFRNFFSINFQTGVVSQTNAVSRTSAKEYNITVKATEVSRQRLSALTYIVIKVMAEDFNSPVLKVSSSIGYVDENSAVGTLVQDADGNNITVEITDADIVNPEELPEYAYEITSTAFMINANGHLIVNQANLDRDLPNENRLSFQIFVRELGVDNPKSSIPVTITVNLRDVNDNAPILEAVSDISVVAGNAKRNIAQLKASDKDGDTKLQFNIVRVTNNGKNIFDLNSRTGKLDLVAPVRSGDHFAITVEVVDSGGKSSQGVIEVRITPQPNLRGPVFTQFLYEAQISEGANKFATVVSTEAKDPEGDLVRYAIVGGNDDGHFLIEESTGEIRVATSLDREEQERYSLLISAQDNGGKANTATVNVKVQDVNDQFPEFVNLPYSFRVIEGQSGASVGNVEAIDGDIGENAVVNYAVEESDDFFDIDQYSGLITTKQELDFESQSVHYLVVQAADRFGPQTASATVTILVQDTSDEIPLFEEKRYVASIAENLQDEVIVSVKAIDKDISSSVTYEIVSGDQNLFKIDPVTGEIRTVKGLDYERQKIHFLTVSTEEARGTFDLGQTSCMVEISVEDVNDNAPRFISVPTANTIGVRNDAKVGSKIALVKAADSDGTEPGNMVEYKIIDQGSSDKAVEYFGIDAESGEIELLGDLTKEVYDEYRLQVAAYDLGSPALETSVTLLIRVQQVVTMPPELGVGFTELRREIQVEENTPFGTVIHILELDQVPNPGLKLDCEIMRVKDDKGKIQQDLFQVVYVTDNNQCQLKVKGVLDKDEDIDGLEVMIKLKTQSAFANPARMITTVLIKLEDINDNKPEFIYDTRHQDKSYLVTISKTTGPNTGIIKVQATDKDSGTFGEVVYSLKDEFDLFMIDGKTGIVVTKGTFDNVPPTALPFRLLVTASDNPGYGTSNSVTTELFVNLIGAEDGIVLVIDDVPVSQMELKRAKLQEILEEQTDFIVSIDHLVPSLVRYPNDTCCRVNKQGTDVYFHVVDSNSGKVLPYDHPLVQSRITNRQSSSDLKYAVSSRLAIQASNIHPPYPDAPGGLPGSQSIPGLTSGSTDSASNFDGLPAALISIGCLVFAFAFAAVMYLVIMRKKQVEEVEKQPKTIVIPRYQPIFVEPNLKEYETQVLQMSVPIDDSDRMFDFNGTGPRRNLRYQASFSIDNISYITKDKTGDSLSTMKTSGDFDSSKDTSHYSTLEGDLDDSFFSRESTGQPEPPATNYLSASRTNDNVIFASNSPDFVSSTPRRKKSHSKSPIDSTTQL